MNNFEEKLINQVQNTILNQISECRLIEYHHKRKKSIPDNIIEKAWDSIDWDMVVSEVTKGLEEKMIQTILQSMLTETKNDVKKILSVQGMREKLRMEAYPKIKQIIENINIKN